MAGISLVIFKHDFPEILVLEVSAGGPGDITRQASWIRPDISVLTALQKIPVHVEFFESREQLFEEKMELVRFTKPNGASIYNANDNFLPELMKGIEIQKIPVGDNSDIHAHSVENTDQGVQAKIVINETIHEVLLPGVWGKTYIQSVLLGCGVLHKLGLDQSEALRKIAENFSPIAGRKRVLSGKKNTTIIDDSYSASPAAAADALRVLESVPARGRKIFLFGDMSELGEFTKQAHLEIADQASEFVNILVTVGDNARITFDRATITVKKHFDTSDEAGKWLLEQIRDGDMILAKSSRHAIKMEQALRHLVTENDKQYLSQEYL